MQNNIERLLNIFPASADACLITSSHNRRYFTSFASSAGMIFITKEKSYFLVDFRYIEKARNTIKNCEVLLLNSAKEQLNELCTKHQVKTLAIESATMSVSQAKRYADMLPNVEIIDNDELSNAITELRIYKSANEVALMKQAQELTDKTFDYALQIIKKGKTEKEIALDMEFFIRKAGADGPSFDFIVVSGTNSSLPHGVPSDKPIEAGDFITMDFGAIVDGYHSDMTRTVAVESVTDEQRFVYDTVLKAQLAALDALKPGIICSDADKIARDIIYSNGFEGCFGHGLGHSVGLEIHEEPRLSSLCSEIVKPNVIYTVEPGIYLEGKFGVRIEDMVLITEDGIDNFTKSEKSLIIL